MKTLLALAVLLFAVAGFAAPADRCLREGNIRYVNMQFNMVLAQAPDYCDPSNRHYKVMEALIFLDRLEFSNRIAPYPYNQDILGTDWFMRIARLSPSILWGPSIAGGAATCSNALAFAGPVPQNLKKMYLCPKAFSDSDIDTASKSSVLSLVDTLLHETRHLEGSGYSHVACYGRKSACDRSASFKGAYALTMEAMAKLAVSSLNVHPALKVSAGRLAYTAATSRFLQPAVSGKLLRQSLVLLHEKTAKGPVAYNYRMEGGAFTYLPAGKIFQLGESDFMLLPDAPEKSEFIFSTYESDGVVDPETSGRDLSRSLTYQLFKNATPEERKNLKASIMQRTYPFEIEASIWGDTVKVRLYSIFSEKSVDVDFKIPEGQPQFLRILSEEGASATLAVLSDQDKMFAVTFEEKTGTPTVTEVPNPHPGYIAVERVEIKEGREAWEARDVARKYKPDPNDPMPEKVFLTYLLNRDGRLFVRHNTETPQPVPALEGRKFEGMSRSLLIFPDLPPELQN